MSGKQSRRRRLLRQKLLVEAVIKPQEMVSLSSLPLKNWGKCRWQSNCSTNENSTNGKQRRRKKKQRQQLEVAEVIKVQPMASSNNSLLRNLVNFQWQNSFSIRESLTNGKLSKKPKKQLRLKTRRMTEVSRS